VCVVGERERSKRRRRNTEGGAFRGKVICKVRHERTLLSSVPCPIALLAPVVVVALLPFPRSHHRTQPHNHPTTTHNHPQPPLAQNRTERTTRHATTTMLKTARALFSSRAQLAGAVVCVARATSSHQQRRLLAASASRPGVRVTIDALNERLRNAQYAVRGGILLEAQRIEGELHVGPAFFALRCVALCTNLT